MRGVNKLNPAKATITDKQPAFAILNKVSTTEVDFTIKEEACVKKKLSNGLKLPRFLPNPRKHQWHMLYN